MQRSHLVLALRAQPIRPPSSNGDVFCAYTAMRGAGRECVRYRHIQIVRSRPRALRIISLKILGLPADPPQFRTNTSSGEEVRLGRLLKVYSTGFSGSCVIRLMWISRILPVTYVSFSSLKCLSRPLRTLPHLFPRTIPLIWRPSFIDTSAIVLFLDLRFLGTGNSGTNSPIGRYPAQLGEFGFRTILVARRL